MKIFVAKKYPAVDFYYEVLNFLLSHATRSEINNYLDIIEENRKKY